MDILKGLLEIGILLMFWILLAEAIYRMMGGKKWR